MDFSEIDLSSFQPLSNRLLVKRFGDFHPILIIPEAYRDYSKTAEVVAVGPKVKEIKRGDVVFLPGMALKYPDFEQQEYAMIVEEDVGGILNEGGNA